MAVAIIHFDKPLKKYREGKLWGFKALKCHWCVSVFPNNLLFSHSSPAPTFKGAELENLLFKSHPFHSDFCGIAALLCKPEHPEEVCLPLPGPLPVSTQIRHFGFLFCNSRLLAASFCALCVAVQRTAPLSPRFELIQQSQPPSWEMSGWLD